MQYALCRPNITDSVGYVETLLGNYDKLEIGLVQLFSRDRRVDFVSEYLSNYYRDGVLVFYELKIVVF